MNAAVSEFGVGAFDVSAKALGPINPVLAMELHPGDRARHCALDVGDSGADITGAACAVPGPNANATPAPAMAIPVAKG
ncbi:hypothetical protein JCM12141A_27250 [Mycolicibacterium hodleri]